MRIINVEGQVSLNRKLTANLLQAILTLIIYTLNIKKRKLYSTIVNLFFHSLAFLTVNYPQHISQNSELNTPTFAVSNRISFVPFVLSL